MNQPAVNDVLRAFSPRKVLLPVILGLGVASYLLWVDFDKKAFSAIEFTWNSALWICIGFLMVGVRDLAYMYRLKVLTSEQLTWKQCFDIIMLWEFSSAVIPPIMGG